MQPSAVQLAEPQIREEIFRQYQTLLPRVGPELDTFVASQCEYFGIREKNCRRYIGLAQHALQAQTRTGIQTETQRIADAMGITRVEILETFREGMRASRKRPIADRSGNVLKDEDGKPMFFETPDYANRIAAADKVAKLIGAYAPKQVHLEATHEHNVTITDDQLRAELASIAGGLGLRVVEADFTVVARGEEAGATTPAGNEVAAGRGGTVLLADESDRDD